MQAGRIKRVVPKHVEGCFVLNVLGAVAAAVCWCRYRCRLLVTGCWQLSSAIQTSTHPDSSSSSLAAVKPNKLASWSASQAASCNGCKAWSMCEWTINQRGQFRFDGRWSKTCVWTYFLSFSLSQCVSQQNANEIIKI